MRMFNWAEAFKEQPSCDDILKKVTKTEILYWIFMLISVAILVTGMNGMANSANDNIKGQIWGLFLAIAGVVNIAVIKLWAHIRLTMYYTIWERNHWIERELKKSEATDI